MREPFGHALHLETLAVVGHVPGVHKDITRRHVGVGIGVAVRVRYADYTHLVLQFQGRRLAYCCSLVAQRTFPGS